MSLDLVWSCYAPQGFLELILAPVALVSLRFLFEPEISVVLLSFPELLGIETSSHELTTGLVVLP